MNAGNFLPTRWLSRPCAENRADPRRRPEDAKRAAASLVGLVSYPRSGNTWLRFLLAHALWPDARPTFRGLGAYVPDWHREEDRRFLEDPCAPLRRYPFVIVKSHETFTRDFPRRIYLFRDGRDALTAYHYWLNARRNVPVRVEALIRGEVPHGSWSAHVESWLEGDPWNTLFVSYESLLTSPVSQLRRLLVFLGETRSDEVLERAVRLSAFPRLRKLEEEHGLFDGREAASDRHAFIRKGVSGDWRTLFTPQEERLFLELHGAVLERLGYGEAVSRNPGAAKDFGILSTPKPCREPTI